MLPAKLGQAAAARYLAEISSPLLSSLLYTCSRSVHILRSQLYLPYRLAQLVSVEFACTLGGKVGRAIKVVCGALELPVA